MGNPTVHPTGTTVYNPDKAFNGYTLFQACEHGATLIDMNGGVVNFWEDLQGFPNKLLPGGEVVGSLGERNSEFGWQDQTDLVQVDFDGNIVWKFDKMEYIEDPGYEPQWMARQHHDYQFEGNTVGYYVPGMEAKTRGGNKLILCHQTVTNPRISALPLCDDTIIEINDAGEILWRWNCNEHFREMGFSEEAKNCIARNPNMTASGGDWMHINSMSVLGPNRHYDNGDERFHPDNIIIDGRQTNIICIISK
ncbi:aryl-sulfate sulfotransferase, partial [Peptococcus niger]